MIVRRDGELDTPSERSVVAIGVFDGLHRGHRAVIAQLLEVARSYGAVATVVTFDPPPASVLAPDQAPRLIGTIDQRLEELEMLDVDQVRVLTFSPDLAKETAAQFIDRVLVKELNACCVVVGEDFHFGHNREGTVATLRAAGEKYGFDLVVAPTHGVTERWSSTSVRRALADGDLDEARSILGGPFTLRGVVVHGDERGRRARLPDGQSAVGGAIRHCPPRVSMRERSRRRRVVAGRHLHRASPAVLRRTGSSSSRSTSSALMATCTVECSMWSFLPACGVRRRSRTKGSSPSRSARTSRKPSSYLMPIRRIRQNC